MSDFRESRRLMDQLKELGIQIQRRGDRLRLSPAAALSPELLEQLKSHKRELLELMRNQSSQRTVTARCARCDWHDWVDEPPTNGRIRTTCKRCGRFIGYRPSEN